jgi:hypothetical protein
MLRKLTFIVLAALLCPRTPLAADLHLNDLDYFDTQGLSVLAYQNLFHDVFRAPRGPGRQGGFQSRLPPHRVFRQELPVGWANGRPLVRHLPAPSRRPDAA